MIDVSFPLSLVHGIHASDVAIARLSAFGATPGTSSRLLRAKGIMRRAIERGGVDPLGEPIFATEVVEAFRTALNFYLIATAVDKVRAIPCRRVRDALMGSTLPWRDSTTTARDAEFECLVAALAIHAGMEGLESGEPDIRIRAGPFVLAVEAKRISAQKQLHRRLRKAMRQIDGTGDLGVIVLGLDAAVAAVFQAKGIDAARATFQEVVQDATTFRSDRADGRRVASIFAFATVLGWVADAQSPGFAHRVMAHAHWLAEPKDHPRIEGFLSARWRSLSNELARLFDALLR
jgi:hypothetical protein